MQRRNLLALLSGIATTTAGCSLTDGGNGNGGGPDATATPTDATTDSPTATPASGELTAFPRYLPDESVDENGHFFVYIDWTELARLGDYASADSSDGTPTPTPTRTPIPDTALEELVSSPLNLSILIGSLRLASRSVVYKDVGSQIAREAGLGRGANWVRDPDVTDVLATPLTTVVTGDLDSADYTGENVPSGFAEAEQRHGYTIYDYDPERDPDRRTPTNPNAAYAVTESRVILGLPNEQAGVEALRNVIDAEAAGERFESDPDGGWTLETAATYPYVIGGIGRQTGTTYMEQIDVSDPRDALGDGEMSQWVAGATLEVVEGSNGEVTTVSARGEFAAVHSDPDTATEGEIRERYADSEADVTVAVTEGASGDSRVAVEAGFDSFRRDPWSGV
jgi:hypothetical protein